MRLTVFNQKGGVGKTTTVINLGAALARCGTSTLLIDLDPQAHLSAIHGGVSGKVEHSVFSYFKDGTALSELEVAWAGIGALIPAHAELIKVDSMFGKGPNILNKLREGLDAVNTDRPVLIDCCPFLGVLSLNAVFAADRILVPVSSDFLSLRGARQIDHTLKALEPVLKHRMQRRYVLTRYDRRRKMSAEVHARMRDEFGADVCESVISENVAVAEAPAFNHDIFSHQASSRGAKDYVALLEELTNCGFI
jgi:chromosome partitioning protein